MARDTTGLMAVDFEVRLDYEKLRRDRVARAREALARSGVGALLCFDPNNVRYLTGSYTGEWHRDKMSRYALLTQEEGPLLFVGNAVKAGLASKDAPWRAGKTRQAYIWMRGKVPLSTGVVDRYVQQISGLLAEYGMPRGPLALDISEIPALLGLQRAGIEIVDGQEIMLAARQIKTPEEQQLLRTAVMMVDVAYARVMEAVKPGIRENDLVALVNHTLYSLGSDQVECVNVTSGQRTNPHRGDFTDRVIRPGELFYLDIMHSFNGYRSCYYRTMCCGKPTAEQKALYQQSYGWLMDAVNRIRPGVSTAEVALAFPEASVWGYTKEEEVFALAMGHGVGLCHWESPIISRQYSLEHPTTLEEGMCIAVETYAGSPGGKEGVRIEEQLLVTAEGCEIISKFPAAELISAWAPTVY